MNIYEMNRQKMIDNKISLPIMRSSTADIPNDEVWNTEHQYCEECECILRWDESETLCKSCESRIEHIK
jgi:hypothetical protein